MVDPHAPRAALGKDQGTVKRVTDQLGFGVKSARGWVKQADVDAGVKPGTTSEVEIPTRRQRRVLDQIEQECRHHGYHATAFPQYDHIKPYENDGPTALANLQRLCGPHNRAKEKSRS